MSDIEPRRSEAFDYDLAVMGLGYVGLPVAIEASRAGLQVLGYDVDAQLIERLSAGKSHIEDVSNEDLVAALGDGFVPSDDGAELARSAAISVSVPTPLRDGVPDLSAVEAAARSVGRHLRSGHLVILESTTYPGTTEELVQPILERESGLRAGVDFHLAYSPERIDPGNREWTLKTTPKLVGGINAESSSQAASLYGKFCDEVVILAGTREAEMAKLLENTYRHVNIALMNEMTLFCREMGIDIWEAIRGAATKPFGFQAFYPGPGVGGHCIPIDPSYMSYRVRQLGHRFRFVELAQEINSRMPKYVVERASELLNRFSKPLRGSHIVLLGVAYKPDVGDTRESPALEVARLLVAKGAEVSVVDPHVKDVTVNGVPLAPLDDALEAVSVADLVVILTPHSEFDLHVLTESAQLVLDTRGVTEASNSVELL